MWWWTMQCECPRVERVTVYNGEESTGIKIRSLFPKAFTSKWWKTSYSQLMTKLDQDWLLQMRGMSIIKPVSIRMGSAKNSSWWICYAFDVSRHVWADMSQIAFQDARIAFFQFNWRACEVIQHKAIAWGFPQWTQRAGLFLCLFQNSRQTNSISLCILKLRTIMRTTNNLWIKLNNIRFIVI